MRAAHLRLTYGLTVEQYDAMLAEQGGRCFLCKALPGKKRLAVDHSHESGAVRRLLCSICNTRLGVYQLLKAEGTFAVFERYLAEFGE